MKMLFTICLILFNLFNSATQAISPTAAIHVLGDSHSLEFSHISQCHIHWLGSLTMHRVGRDGFSAVYLPSLGVQEGDAVIFAFGEIDVRCHIGRQRDLFNRDVNEIINTLVAYYLYTILQNKILYNQLTCIVYSITPPTDITYNPAYPFYGTLQDRVNLTKHLNAVLAQVCSLHGIKFLDVYENYANPDGSLNIALSDGIVHISPYHFLPIQTMLYQLLGQ